MTLRRYKACNFRQDSLERIEICNKIIEKYESQNLRLTLRQLYYQLVSRNIITNEEKSYKSLGKLVSDARLGGLMSWDAIEDRVRVPKRASEFRDLKHLTEAAGYAYRLPRWEGQDNYVELWVENDALAGVLAPIANRYHITLMVNRGYSSQSAMYEAGQRFLANRFTEIHTNDLKNKKRLVVDSLRPGEKVRDLNLLYLGDHDPSGEDMVRDVHQRLEMFSGTKIHIQKVALTIAQVKEYNPPPNPAMMSDSRARRYVEEHGDESWEVDAIPPEDLTTIIEEAIEGLVDLKRMDEVIKREELDKKRLAKAVEKIMST